VERQRIEEKRKKSLAIERENDFLH